MMEDLKQGEVAPAIMSPCHLFLKHCEVLRVLFLGMCLVFHYFVAWVMFPKLGLHLDWRIVAEALIEP